MVLAPPPPMSLACLSKKYLFIYLFIYWLRWLFIAACGLSLLAASGGYSSLRCAGFSYCGGFCCRAQAIGAQASVVVACGLSSCGSQALEHRLSSCGARAQLLRGMWDLPGPGLKPVSPALAGGFLTTAPPRKSQPAFCLWKNFSRRISLIREVRK